MKSNVICNNISTSGTRLGKAHTLPLPGTTRTAFIIVLHLYARTGVKTHFNTRRVRAAATFARRIHARADSEELRFKPPNYITHVVRLRSISKLLMIAVPACGLSLRVLVIIFLIGKKEFLRESVAHSVGRKGPSQQSSDQSWPGSNRTRHRSVFRQIM